MSKGYGYDELCLITSKELQKKNKNNPTDYELIRELLKDLLAEYDSIEQAYNSVKPDGSYITPKGHVVAGQAILTGARIAKNNRNLSPLPLKGGNV